jgi:hypothetical protein
MIRIVPKFNQATVRKMIEEKKERIRQAIILRLQKIGEEFIVNARHNGTYTDRTGNLRSSIGYVILDNGKQLFEKFPGSSEEGKDAAKVSLEQAAQGLDKGLVLIVCAGMEYAAAVESKGYDVLTASGKVAEKSLRAAIKIVQGKTGA